MLASLGRAAGLPGQEAEHADAGRTVPVFADSHAQRDYVPGDVSVQADAMGGRCSVRSPGRLNGRGIGSGRPGIMRHDAGCVCGIGSLVSADQRRGLILRSAGASASGVPRERRPAQGKSTRGRMVVFPRFFQGLTLKNKIRINAKRELTFKIQRGILYELSRDGTAQSGPREGERSLKTIQDKRREKTVDSEMSFESWRSA